MQKENKLPLSGTEFCVCYHLRRTSRSITQLYDTALQPSGIRSTQFALLVAIAKKEPINISEMGELLGMDQTTLSRSLRNLAGVGHITLVPGVDRRERLASLTTKGRQVLRKALPYWRRIQREVVSKLANPDWRNIQKNLKAVKDVSQQIFEAFPPGSSEESRQSK
jgi:DNA-binding MarR family transcriptional regulator